MTILSTFFYGNGTFQLCHCEDGLPVLIENKDKTAPTNSVCELSKRSVKRVVVMDGICAGRFKTGIDGKTICLADKSSKKIHAYKIDFHDGRSVIFDRYHPLYEKAAAFAKVFLES